MIIIMHHTLKYVIELSNNPKIDIKQIESINNLWEHASPDNMRETIDGIKYIKLEL